MAKRMRYDNERFAKDFAKNFPKLGVDTQEEAGEKLGVSQNAIHSWLSGSSFPQKDKWKVIAEKVGIDPSDYRVNVQCASFKVDNSASVTNSHRSVAAAAGATVTYRTDVDLEPKISAEVTPREYEAIQAIRSIGGRIIEAVILFDLYGNKAGLEKCISELLKSKDLLDR